ncbi:MAG: hypothetical protein M1355_04305 [Patescibacteria group bacterium]|nr:hypothetical protein [Patescibacteria group bacterium]
MSVKIKGLKGQIQELKLIYNDDLAIVRGFMYGYLTAMFPLWAIATGRTPSSLTEENVWQFQQFLDTNGFYISNEARDGIFADYQEARSAFLDDKTIEEREEELNSCIAEYKIAQDANRSMRNDALGRIDIKGKDFYQQ